MEYVRTTLAVDLFLREWDTVQSIDTTSATGGS